jgi:hypothetical protein
MDVEELEDHLRSQVEELREAGLDDEEAFLIAVKRIGALDALSREYAQEYSERLWKRLVVTPEGAEGGGSWSREGLVALVLAIGAAVAIKLPSLFGVGLEAPDGLNVFYARNASFFVLPFLAAFFAWKRSLTPGGWVVVSIPFVVGAAVINLFPFAPRGSTEVLAMLHLPLGLWLVGCFAYAGGLWKDHNQRMNFIRFSGEWFIYYALIAFGGGVLMGITMFIFNAIGVDAERFVQLWVMPCGIVGAVLVAAWLVEAKQSVIENMAPVLARIFSPLFALLLVAFIATMVWTGRGIDVEREVLIAVDFLLVVVFGLLLYSISAREPAAPRSFVDLIQVTLVGTALLVDVIALWAIAVRISDFGFTPNRTAALGMNIILLVNLAGSLYLYVRFLRGNGGVARLLRWQATYVYAIAAWATTVAYLFPPLFGFD